VVLLSGEPGIGKSRLTAAVLERLAAEPHTRLRYFCSPQHTDSALYPTISQMERAAGFTQALFFRYYAPARNFAHQTGMG
jgi:predicted ATPase